MNRPSQLLASVLILPFLISCSASQEPQAGFDEYLYRLGNSLKVPSDIRQQVEKPSGELLRYPSTRQLAHSLLPATMNLIEFLSLSKCDLQRHIGQRNSSLGRFMEPSQLLIYEYEFIRLADQCLSQLGNKERHAALLDVVKQKRKQLPLVQWNAIFTSEELVTLFSLGSQPLTAEQLKQKPSELYLALETLALFLDNQVDDMTNIETAYGVIASSKRIGELRLSMNLMLRYLMQADVLLQYRIQAKPLCFKQKPNQQFEIVNTVFLKYYIGQIQAYIALLHQEASMLFEKVDQLAATLPQVESFKYFWQQVYQGESSEWQRFEKAVKNHTRAWQALLKQCGRLPR